MVNSLTNFWIRHPALFHAISLLLAFYAFSHSFKTVLIPCFLFWIPFGIQMIQKKILSFPFLLNLSLGIVAYLFFSVFYIFPTLPDKGVTGKAHLSIDSFEKQSSPFGQKWNFKCTLLNFFPDSSPLDSIAKNIKCTISLPQTYFFQRPLAQRDYLITGKLVNDNDYYRLKVSPLEPWLGLAENWGTVEYRYLWKETISHKIQKQFKDSANGHFLAALATGSVDSKWIQNEFSRFGLQHLLAISGFHFALIAGLLSFFLRLFFSRKIQAFILFAFLAFYFIFLGFNASVIRAWVMCSLFILSGIVEKQTLPLNNLGIALMIVLLIDPHLLNTIAFQFSFGVTAFILLGYSPINRGIEHWFPKRRLEHILEMDRWNQHGYIILTLFKQAFALSVAINLISFPLTLYFFEKFPIMGLIYNLFFPFLVSISLFLLFLGTLFSLFPYVGNFFHYFNDFYTNLILKLTYQMPDFIDYYIEIESLNFYVILCYLSFISLLLIIAHQHCKENSHSSSDSKWVFI